MIRTEGFIKRKLGGQYVVVAVGDAARRFAGMISLNQTGAYLWELLEQPTDVRALVAALVEKYDVDADTATRDVQAFLAPLKEVGAIVE